MDYLLDTLEIQYLLRVGFFVMKPTINKPTVKPLTTTEFIVPKSQKCKNY